MRPASWIRIAAVVSAGSLHAAVACAAAQPEREWSLQVIDHVERYRIHGDTARKLREQLRDHGPRRGIEGHGRTHSDFQLEYGLVHEDDACHVDGRAIRLVITTTLPDWVPPPGVSQELREHWQVAEGALARHERGHRDHAVAAAGSLTTALARLPVAADCKRAWAGITRELRKAMWKLRQRGIRYDTRTDNGRREDFLDNP